MPRDAIPKEITPRSYSEMEDIFTALERLGKTLLGVAEEPDGVKRVRIQF